MQLKLFSSRSTRAAHDGRDVAFKIQTHCRP